MVATIADILKHGAAAHGDALALEMFGADGPVRRYTFREVARRADLVARQLRAWGIAPGGRVALVGENCPEWGIAAFGVYAAGAVLVPLDSKLKPGEVSNILRRSRADLLLSSARLMPAAQEAARDLAAPRVACVDGLLSGDALAGAARLAPVGDLCRPDDVALISFTSGTTGAPKGIVLLHRNIVANVLSAAASVVACGPDDHFVSLLPLNHLFEHTVGFLLPYYCGAGVTYLRSLKPKTVLAALEATGATLCLIVPAVARLFHKQATAMIAGLPWWRRMLFRGLFGTARAAGRAGVPLGPVILGNVGRRFGSRMRQFISGGAPLEPETAEFFSCVGLPILQGYGLSEAGPVVSSNTPGANRLGSVGQPVRDVEVRIVPRDGFEPGAGEVLVRGPNVMQGYFEAPEATAEVLRDGWLSTGDIGRLDPDGYLHICGRIKDVIIGSSGKNVYPDEIEQQIAGRPFIKEACVVGRPAGGRGTGQEASEEIVVLVVPADEIAADLPRDDMVKVLRNELRDACRALADYKRPRYFTLCEGDLPRTTTLKLKKHEIVGMIDGLPLTPL